MKLIKLHKEEIITKNQMLEILAGECQVALTCSATKGDVTHTFTNCNKDLMYSWARAWDAADFTIHCRYSYKV